MKSIEETYTESTSTNSPICFVKGTKIKIVRNGKLKEVPIEKVRVGDYLPNYVTDEDACWHLDEGKLFRVDYIHEQNFSKKQLKNDKNLRPIVFEPFKKLEIVFGYYSDFSEVIKVSRQHLMRVVDNDGKHYAIPAKDFLFLESVYEGTSRDVEYFHIRAHDSVVPVMVGGFFVTETLRLQEGNMRYVEENMPDLIDEIEWSGGVLHDDDGVEVLTGKAAVKLLKSLLD